MVQPVVRFEGQAVRVAPHAAAARNHRRGIPVVLAASGADLERPNRSWRCRAGSRIFWVRARRIRIGTGFVTACHPELPGSGGARPRGLFARCVRDRDTAGKHRCRSTGSGLVAGTSPERGDVNGAPLAGTHWAGSLKKPTPQNQSLPPVVMAKQRLRVAKAAVTSVNFGAAGRIWYPPGVPTPACPHPSWPHGRMVPFLSNTMMCPMPALTEAALATPATGTGLGFDDPCTFWPFAIVEESLLPQTRTVPSLSTATPLLPPQRPMRPAGCRSSSAQVRIGSSHLPTGQEKSNPHVQREPSRPSAYR